jgi:uncharacterized protein (UPF0371 family)
VGAFASVVARSWFWESISIVSSLITALSASKFVNPMASLALEQIGKLRGCQLHTTAIPPQADAKIYRKLGINATSDPIYATNQVYFD